ncbi:chemotaxis protein CheB [Cohnella yongneupensis]|uniref:Protein-glutamate methylesterase/protein-glutamine glutaminase n=1 Tax=Cohnella yongneupensis TaxID=425006 RepID=A0ABW0R7G7_9BACL
MSEYNVLIVDDSPFMRKVFSDVVDADASFNVLATAGNGKEAVELALKLKPDIITMDLEMPQMNGIEALKRIMSVRPTPIIMLSAVTDNGTRDTIKALQYGAFDFIRKPDGAVRLDIHQVGEQLLEKLHIAVSSVSAGALRMLPAVEEKAEAPPKKELPKQPSAPSLLHSAPTEDQTTVAKQIVHKDPPVNDIVKRATVNLPKTPLPTIEWRAPKPPTAKSPADKQAPAQKQPDAVKESGSARLNGNLTLAGKEQVVLPEAKRAAETTAKKQVEPAMPPPAIEEVTLPPSRSAGKKRSTSGAFSQIVVIGTSTGGPRALHEVLTGIPAGFPAPILIVQHMPPKFTHSLAQRLDSFCNIHVREASDGEVVENATAYIAPGGYHMSLAKDARGGYKIRLSEEPPRSGHRPSVDVLFESLVSHVGLKRHAVLMTGMGSDGAKGMKALQASGVLTTIAEAEETCVVYGMPRSAIELGAASHVLPLQSIASALVREVQARKT